MRGEGTRNAGEPNRDRARWAARVLAAALLPALVANCSSNVATGRKIDPRYGVAPSPKVIADGEPVPKGGGRAMIGKPYVVGERTYVPRDGNGYVREGWASWYGSAFHGRLTANGEVFDRDSIAAAHPTLPLPSYVRVTNLQNRRSMLVRVNDRGPYERDRLLDISERAADALGFKRIGTTRVRVEYVGKASLQGSDDAKLLASLRTDGEPAALGRGKGPTMLADLGPASPPVSLPGPIPEAPTPLAFKTAATSPAVARGAGGDEDDADEPAPVPLPAPRPAAAGVAPLLPSAQPRLAAQPPARPVAGPGTAAIIAAAGPLPPERPVLAGIY